MARMYPASIYEGTKSPGEKQVFYKLKDDPATKSWIVLHSLGVAKHSKRISGELDFLVIVPGRGVLCVEVKAGSVQRRNGIWKYGKGAGAKKSKISPFQQVSDAMHDVRNYVAKINPSLQKKLFFSAVLFTGIEFHEQSTEWHPWQFADKTQLNRKPISKILAEILNNAHKRFSEIESTAWYKEENAKPNLAEADTILEILRRDFEYHLSPLEERQSLENKIFEFTNEQFGAIDLFEYNDRIIYQGLAGTGKTLLALEAAKRKSANGARVAFFCYNQFLGRWLKQEVSKIGETATNIVVGTFHSYMIEMLGEDSVTTKVEDYWSTTLPSLVIDRYLSDETEISQFDVLIIDEAQDLITDFYLDVMDMLLKGGLAGGRWVFFGDFEKQAIYRDDGLCNGADLISNLDQRAPHNTKYLLETNCRNSPEIGHGIQLLFNLEPGYKEFLNFMERKSIRTSFYDSGDKQISTLRDCLNDIQKTLNIQPKDIVVLSFNKDKNCCAEKLNTLENGRRLIRYRENDDHANKIRYCTIHAFKGLESPLIIVTDIDQISGDYYESLLYVALSRARHDLFLLINSSCKRQWKERIERGL